MAAVGPPRGREEHRRHAYERERQHQREGHQRNEGMASTPSAAAAAVAARGLGLGAAPVGRCLARLAPAALQALDAGLEALDAGPEVAVEQARAAVQRPQVIGAEPDVRVRPELRAEVPEVRLPDGATPSGLLQLVALLEIQVAVPIGVEGGQHPAHLVHVGQLGSSGGGLHRSVAICIGGGGGSLSRRHRRIVVVVGGGNGGSSGVHRRHEQRSRRRRRRHNRRRRDLGGRLLGCLRGVGLGDGGVRLRSKRQQFERRRGRHRCRRSYHCTRRGRRRGGGGARGRRGDGEGGDAGRQGQQETVVLIAVVDRPFADSGLCRLCKFLKETLLRGCFWDQLELELQRACAGEVEGIGQAQGREGACVALVIEVPRDEGIRPEALLDKLLNSLEGHVALVR
mmetsp:Transcript_27001/g.89620  ORF Transcript_27001/g.89620 Transcript_27001/m.89620 type:complete len:398 (+) Transcript_27001:226-1419(+)